MWTEYLRQIISIVVGCDGEEPRASVTFFAKSPSLEYSQSPGQDLFANQQ